VFGGHGVRDGCPDSTGTTRPCGNSPAKSSWFSRVSASISAPHNALVAYLRANTPASPGGEVERVRSAITRRHVAGPLPSGGP
jgi:hypothetical protein